MKMKTGTEEQVAKLEEELYSYPEHSKRVAMYLEELEDLEYLKLGLSTRRKDKVLTKNQFAGENSMHGYDLRLVELSDKVEAKFVNSESFQVVKRVDEVLDNLNDEDRYLIIAHFIYKESYRALARRHNYSKSSMQRRVKNVLYYLAKKVDEK